MTERSPPYELSLQPLRIPQGWYVAYNGFTEAEPVEGFGDLYALNFREDLLQLTHQRCNRLIDLGWYPDGDVVHGQFRIVVHEGDFLGSQIHMFESRSRLAVAAELERLMIEIGHGRL